MRLRAILPMFLALGVVGACAYDDYGHGARYGQPGYGVAYGDYAYTGYAYTGDHWRGRSARFGGDLSGPGLEVLDPWLLHTQEGREIVTRGFRDAAHGHVDVELAHRINVWFRRYADTDRDMCLTDAEIRVALVQASRDHGPRGG